MKQSIRVFAETAKPPSSMFSAFWGRDDVRDALWLMQRKKCAYCERARDRNRESDIEHFRPKAEVREADPAHKGYWWLAYDWSNLLFSCRHCNQEHKKSQFPIPDEARRAFVDTDSLSDENAFLLDPSRDQPEQHFAYDWGDKPTDPFVWIVPRAGSERASRTIEVLELNRQELLEERSQCVETLRVVAKTMDFAKMLNNAPLVAETALQIRSETSAERPFAGFRRDYFRKQGLAEYVSSD